MGEPRTASRCVSRRNGFAARRVPTASCRETSDLRSGRGNDDPHRRCRRIGLLAVFPRRFPPCTRSAGDVRDWPTRTHRRGSAHSLPPIACTAQRHPRGRSRRGSHSTRSSSRPTFVHCRRPHPLCLRAGVRQPHRHAAAVRAARTSERRRLHGARRTCSHRLHSIDRAA